MMSSFDMEMKMEYLRSLNSIRAEINVYDKETNALKWTLKPEYFVDDIIYVVREVIVNKNKRFSKKYKKVVVERDKIEYLQISATRVHYIAEGGNTLHNYSDNFLKIGIQHMSTQSN